MLKNSDDDSLQILNYEQCRHLSILVRENFKEKYSEIFNFYLRTPIDNIIYNNEQNFNNIRFKDASVFSEQCQYMKRQYFYTTVTGKPQISNRILLLAQFYQDKPTIGSHYPTMILTNTVQIFLKRYHRISKTANPNDSSLAFESLEEQNQIQANTDSLHLYNCQLSHLQNCLSEDSQQNQAVSIGSEHDIYEQYKIQRQTKQIFHFLSSNDLLGSSLSHLICDYDDFNVEQTVINFSKYETRYKKKQINKQSKLLTKISIQPIDQYQNTNNRVSKLNEKSWNYHHVNSMNKNYIRQNNSNEIIEQTILKNQNGQKRAQEDKKKKVREKAVQLLGLNQFNSKYNNFQRKKHY